MNADAVARALTADAPGGVAVVEVAGPGAAARVERILGRPLPPPGRVRLARLEDDGVLLDEGLVLVRSTGRVELHLHGSPAVVERVLAALRADPWPAPRSWAELAAERLAAAVGEAGARVLLDQAEGALDRALDELEHVPDAAARARDLVERWRRARPYLRPPVVVLLGPVNAGKSTLFNLLVGHERALASATAGTTRDAVGEWARDGDLVVELVDTAGARELAGAADGPVAALEAAGQRLAFERAARADLVLVCTPPGADAPTVPEGVPRVRVVTRAGPGASGSEDPPRVRATEEPELARAAVWRALRAGLAVHPRPHEPGAAVPLDGGLAHRLDEHARRGDAAVRAAARAGAFAPRGGDGPPSRLDGAADLCEPRDR